MDAVSDLDQFGLPDKRFSYQPMCDACPSGFEKGDYVLLYFTDTIWSSDLGPQSNRIGIADAYCMDCYTNEIPLPCNGAYEGITMATLEPDEVPGKYYYDEIGVLNISNRSEGVEWAPPEIYEKLHHKSIRDFEHTVTPMLTFMNFFQLGIDIRGFVKNNKMVIPEEAAEHAKKVIKTTSLHRPRHSFSTYDL